MGFKQTDTHRFGKAFVPPDRPGPRPVRQRAEDEWLKFIADDRLRRLGGGELGARPAPVRHRRRRRRPTPRSASTWPRSTAWRSSPSPPTCKARPWATSRRAKTLQFIGGEAVAAYKAWRDKGNKPPRTDPYFVPDEVGKLIHEQAQQGPARLRPPGRTTSASCRTARWPLPGFVGSPAHCWSHWFLFPPLPGEHRRPRHPRRPRRSAWSCSSSASARSGTLCKKYGVTFDLECHPSERAMGDIESAGDYLNRMDKAGYEGVVGFNLDGSHMEWQGVSVVAVHPRVRRPHPLRPHQGRAGGPRAHAAPAGWAATGRWATRHNGWNFVTAGTARDANSLEEIFIELNRVGFDGAVQHRVGGQRRRAARRGQGGPGQRAAGPTCRPAACGTTRCSRRRCEPSVRALEPPRSCPWPISPRMML